MYADSQGLWGLSSPRDRCVAFAAVVAIVATVSCYCCLADIDEHRLQVAKEIGATYTVKVTSRDSRALANEIEATLGCQPDCSMECSGAEPSIATAIHVRNTHPLAGCHSYGRCPWGFAGDLPLNTLEITSPQDFLDFLCVRTLPPPPLPRRPTKKNPR